MSIETLLSYEFKNFINITINGFYNGFTSEGTQTINKIYLNNYTVDGHYKIDNITKLYKFVNLINLDGDMVHFNILYDSNSIYANKGIFQNFNFLNLTDTQFDAFIGSTDYDKCNWYNFICHARNIISYVVYDLPIISDVTTAAKNLFNTAKGIFTNFAQAKNVTFFGTACFMSLGIHFLKRGFN